MFMKTQFSESKSERSRGIAGELRRCTVTCAE
jgi:hypothetical protein